MDKLDTIIPLYKRLYLKFKSLRNIPFRTQFFVGYDLSGNTYWEFFNDRHSAKLFIKGIGIRPRRKYIPFQRREFIHDYYESVPVQWLQWLRHTRPNPPTIQELIGDEQRKQSLKQLVKLKELELKDTKNFKEVLEDDSLNSELENINKVSQKLNVSSSFDKVIIKSKSDNEFKKPYIKSRR